MVVSSQLDQATTYFNAHRIRKQLTNMKLSKLTFTSILCAIGFALYYRYFPGFR